MIDKTAEMVEDATSQDGSLPFLNASLGANIIAMSRLNDEMSAIEYVAEGSFGVVKRGIHDIDRRCYAIKKTKEPIFGEGDLQRRLQEVYALSSGKHRNILRYYDGWVEDGSVFIRTEYLPESVSQLPRPLAEATLVDILHQTGSALHHLHASGIVHRDVKPENILARRHKDGSYTYKLCDFGLSRPSFRYSAATGEQFQGMNDDDGDRNYLSPEAFARCDCSEGGCEMDVYALGCTCVELMCGDPSQARDGVFTCDFNLYSSNLERLVRQMTSANPKDRPTAFHVASVTLPATSRTPEVLERERELRAWRKRLQELKQ